jgi:hypothetical protein
VKWVKISGKAGLKIHSESTSKAEHLVELLQSLQTLLLEINQGDWDRVCENSEHFLSILEAAQKPDFLSAINAGDINKIRLVLTMLESAIQQCSVRKEEIAPLLKALTIAKDASKTR